VYPIKINSIGKIILFEDHVLPLGDYELPSIVRDLTDVTDIRCCNEAFVVVTSSIIYMFNKTNCIQIDNNADTRIFCLTDHCIIHDNTRCFIYNNILTNSVFPLSGTITTHPGCFVYSTNEQIIVRTGTTLLYFTSISSTPILLTNMLISYDGFTYLLNPINISAIIGTQNGIFIIRLNNKLVLLDNQIMNGNYNTFSFRISKLLNTYTLSSYMQIYATKNQFTIADTNKLYVVPLVEDSCLTHDELNAKIQGAIFQVDPNTQVISLTNNCQLYNAGVKAINFADNLTGFTPTTFVSSNIQTMGEGFVIDDILYYNNSLLVSPPTCTTQQVVNYIYTLSKIFVNPNSLLSQYFIKNNTANTDGEWTELTTRYPSSLVPDIPLNTFIQMFYSKNISYARIQNVVLNSDILNIFRIINPVASPVISFTNISESVAWHKDKKTYEENIIKILAILQLMNILLRYKN